MEQHDENDEGATAATTDGGEMTRISRYSFSTPGQTDEAFSIDIIENIKEDYGLFVWPCSIVLAEYVWQQRLRFSGTSVVELGAGTSLPGLVAAKLGSDVTLADNSKRLEVLDNMRRMCDLNKVGCKVLGLTWGEWDTPIFGLHPAIVLGADVLYDSSDFDDLFATVTFLLQNSPGSVFITTYHNRRVGETVWWMGYMKKTRENRKVLPQQRALVQLGPLYLVTGAITSPHGLPAVEN